MALNLNTFTVGVVVFGGESAVQQNDLVVRSGALVSINVGDHLLGRVINALGEFVDVADNLKVVENKDAEAEELKAAFEKLQGATHKVTSEMYKQQEAPQGSDNGTGAGADTAGASEKKDDDVIDADYKDVN